VTSSPPRRDAAVEGGFDGAPIRQVLGEDGLESRAVRRFEEVGQFMEHHVIDGGRRLFGQFEVEDDVAALRSARPPLAFHGADADGWGRDAEPGTPRRHELVEARVQFAAVQPIEVALDFGGVPWVAGVDEEAPLNGLRAGPLACRRPHLQPLADPEEPMLLPRLVAEFGARRQCGDARLVTADPIGFGGNELRDARFRHPQRRRHRHAAVGRVYAQVHVLDAFARELEFDAGGGHD